ncbi:AraC family transcriptional regulator [Pseudomonas sp. dw_358]|uniref:AraC family transcriptional regulator n=1 Tax=Pseudomonas sp. dw_358 TaxID=2720083 RepID=UPI001BD3FDEF|nr:AraC family transcriptional regulator [Pseudomonas sp. dw_358]
MTDPLAEVVALLQPSARYSKTVTASGPWRVRRRLEGQPFYTVLLEGSCGLSVHDQHSIDLHAGDFVLIPAPNGSDLFSSPPPPEALSTQPVQLPNGEFRLGDLEGLEEVRMLVGHCAFASPDAALLVSLLPDVVHVRGNPRLSTLVQLLGEESRGQRPAREEVLTRLLEVLFIEALRASAGVAGTQGLLQGLADPRLAAAIREIHTAPTQPWTVAELARHAALSRSAFFERFNRAVGMPPMMYLLTWRMALAKNLLRSKDVRLAQVAEQVGYSSASAFSVAFTRHVGVAPTRYERV